MKSFLVKSIILGIVLLTSANGVIGQVYSSVNAFNKAGLINSKETYREIKGDPFLFKDYKTASIKFANSNAATYSIKYDQLEDKVIVKGPGTEEYAFNDAVAEFNFKDDNKLFRAGFAPVGKMTEKSFYQIIHDGKTKYIKRLGKIIIESKGYNTPTIEKKVETDNSYYIVRNDNIPVLVKNNEKSIIAMLDKKGDFSKYIKDNKLNLKNDEDVTKFLSYYDSL